MGFNLENWNQLSIANYKGISTVHTCIIDLRIIQANKQHLLARESWNYNIDSMTLIQLIQLAFYNIYNPPQNQVHRNETFFFNDLFLQITHNIGVGYSTNSETKAARISSMNEKTTGPIHRKHWRGNKIQPTSKKKIYLEISEFFFAITV